MLLTIKNLHKEFRRGKEVVHVLNDLGIEVPKGDFLALMGPSGSGKSTLLNMIGGIDRPTSGSITFDGVPVDD
ncbi:MAG: ATP-binding cassette domain-containing protein, partial [Gammaproteobacteria bacterium]|nr:ATP-binding cassette domain-containing protein [Gammaproteobacteria bacterium]